MGINKNKMLGLWAKVYIFLNFCIREFRTNRCALRASSLTLFTLMSIVPIMAMAFGVAKGFGFQKAFERRVYEVFSGQEQIISNVLEFSTRTLEKTQGGLMAVLGLLVLFYSLIKLIGHIENSFNTIFCVEKDRTWIRKFTDYIAIALTAGFLSFFSGSANIFVTTFLKGYLARMDLMESLEKAIRFGFQLFPFISIWMLFIFIYLFIPNKKMKIHACLAGGIAGGTIFQITQILYLKFQVWVTSYNAIYGSFAALPLFLIWLQVSWLIILLGAVIVFAWESAEESSLQDVDWAFVNIRSRKLAALSITLLCVKSFAGGESAPTDVQIARQLQISLKFIRMILTELVNARILSQVTVQDTVGYSPAHDIAQMSISGVLKAFERGQENFLETHTLPDIQKMEQILISLDKDMDSNTGAILLREM